jgi:eukaryotic-like serine/threonine-protein kinase
LNPERLQQIEQLYHKVSSLDDRLRDEFLKRVCLGDEGLRKEVESLLSHEKQAEGFLESSALQKEAPSLAEGWAEAPAPEVGSSIGRYQVLEKIGAGGMGLVYRARDTHLGRTVALKVLPSGLTADREHRARFVREAKAASALNHPNIITIYDIGEADGIEFIAMEYVQGQTLRELIAGQRLTFSEALSIALQVVEALHAAHSAGIIHRDIKPANIMILVTQAEQRKAKLLDFGLAKLMEPHRQGEAPDAETMNGAILGTAAYMSPEQAEGKSIDARSDIFSLGAALYEMISGRRPFQGKSNFAVLNAVLHEEPAPLTGIPSEIQNILSRCLRKDPGLRFQTAGDLRLALEACRPFPAASSGLSAKSIAVLPFANVSGDKNNDYFSDGLTEEMINSLTKLQGLQVTARTSAFALRYKDLDIREIGSKLNVEYILQGSVRRAGNRMRVTAQLVNVKTGYHLWSERYDREMTDVFAIQDEISQAIVETLRLRLIKGPVQTSRHPADFEAYSLYLKGRHFQEKRTPEGYAKAKAYFEQALALDSKYALSLLGLAEFHWLNAFYGFHYPKEALRRSKEATLRALEIDDTLPEAHAILGALLGLSDFDWAAAERSFQRAMDLDSSSSYVLFRYANFYLRPNGRPAEAVKLLERSLEIDPLSVVTLWTMAYYQYSSKQYDRAIKHLLSVIDLEPSFYLAPCVMGLAYAQLGMEENSIAALEKAGDLVAGNPFTTGLLAYAKGKAGQTEEAFRLIEKLRFQAEKSYVPAKSFMFAYAGLEDWTSVLDWAEKSVDDRDPMSIMNLLMEPTLDPVRSDRRYAAIFRKMNLNSVCGAS